MINWFVILIPILLLPIAVLFYFVGCTFDGSSFVPSSEVTFYIGFYLDDNRLNHTFEFKIFNTALNELASSETIIDTPDETGPDTTSRVSHRFTRHLSTGTTTLSCEVRDLTTVVDGLPLVSNGDVCQHLFLNNEAYFVVFNAGISEDGMTPSTEFDACTVVEI